ncbi:MAG: OmpA family protein [Burkholderiales bacterium]|nr:OmpA family protein [Burkholderiales bacterium]MDE2452603.1 OmpA family protein [Burkholderiales bacterium]
MPGSRTLGFALTALACAAFALPARAQNDTVLSGSHVTEDALENALSIDTPENAAAGKTRGFQPRQRTKAVAATGSGKANLMITFETDSATLTAEDRKTLDVVANALQSDKLAGFAFKIEGHADPRGSDEHNQILSELRAKAVVDYLVNVRGVLPERLVAIGKGSNDLFDPKRPDAPENRRVTVVTTH